MEAQKDLTKPRLKRKYVIKNYHALIINKRILTFIPIVNRLCSKEVL